MKKLFIIPLLVLLVGCGSKPENKETILKLKVNPVIDILRKNFPDSREYGSPLDETLNLNVYWGESFDSIAKKKPSIRLKGIDNGLYQYSTATALLENDRVVEIITLYYFSAAKRLLALQTGIAIGSSTRIDKLGIDISNAYKKILNDLYGDPVTQDAIKNFAYQQWAYASLDTMYRENEHVQAIEVTIGDPALKAIEAYQ